MKGRTKVLNGNPMKQVNFYNEKGNVATKVRAEIKDQVTKFLMANLTGLEVTPRGLALPVAVTERGETVYAFLPVTISTQTELKETAPKAKEVEVSPVGSLFE